MKFSDVINLEGEIWAKAYASSTGLIPGWTAFWEPEYGDNPHWNILYPGTSEARLEPGQIKRVSEFYRSMNLCPHVLDVSRPDHSGNVSRDEYFVLPAGRRDLRLGGGLDLEVRPTEDLRLFTDTLREIFDLPNEFTAYFVSKMERLVRSLVADFYLAYKDDKIIGCWSTFSCGDEARFMMNFGVLPGVRLHGYSRMLMNAVVSTEPRTLCTHTNNPVLATRLLPAAGFLSVGRAAIVPLDSYGH